MGVGGACHSAIHAVHEAAWKIIPSSACAVALAVVADGPSLRVLAEAIVLHLCWRGLWGQLEILSGFVVVHLEFVRPAIDAVPCGVHLSVFPSPRELAEGEFSDHGEVGPLVGPVVFFPALVASVRRLGACVVQPRVEDDVRGPLDDTIAVFSRLWFFGRCSACLISGRQPHSQ